MKRTIAIVSGGFSSEYVISMKSAESMMTFLNSEHYDLYQVLLIREEWSVILPDGQRIPIDKNDFSFTYNNKHIVFDYAYIVIHGTPGEDGLLQGYFDMLQIPYSSCGVLASSLTFNKYVCNSFLHAHGIPVADSIRLQWGETVSSDEVVKRLGLPVFIKPCDGGSSFGITKVKTPDAVPDAISKAFSEGTEVIIESYLAGVEVTCGLYKIPGKEVVFPLTEVVTENEFFDFDAKYNGQVEEITPARIPDEWTARIQKMSSVIYDLLGAKGIIRVDYIVSPEGNPVVLEINTSPGMTVTSFIPQQVKAAGLHIKEVMSEIVESSFASL